MIHSDVGKFLNFNPIPKEGFSEIRGRTRRTKPSELNFIFKLLDFQIFEKLIREDPYKKKNILEARFKLVKFRIRSTFRSIYVDLRICITQRKQYYGTNLCDLLHDSNNLK